MSSRALLVGAIVIAVAIVAAYFLFGESRTETMTSIPIIRGPSQTTSAPPPDIQPQPAPAPGPVDTDETGGAAHRPPQPGPQ